VVTPKLALRQGRLLVSGRAVVLKVLGVRIRTEYAAQVPGEAPEAGGDCSQAGAHQL
jgi:hypothetical protein